MKLNLIILGISILTAYGCSPQSQQPTEQTGPNSSSALPSMLLRNDPPNCDSEDTREIVKDIIGKHAPALSNNYTSRKICFSKVPTKGFWPEVFFTDNCDTLLDGKIAGSAEEYEKLKANPFLAYSIHIPNPDSAVTITASPAEDAGRPSDKELQEYKLTRLNEYLQELKLIRQNLAVHDDLVFSYKSYLVKSENRAPDGNSNVCSLRVVPQIDSQSAGYTYSPESEWYEINLTLYKLDQNGERAYEYDRPLLRKAE